MRAFAKAQTNGISYRTLSRQERWEQTKAKMRFWRRKNNGVLSVIKEKKVNS